MSRDVVIVYGSGASYGSGYKVTIRGTTKGSPLTMALNPPTDKDFFTVITDTLLQVQYKALRSFMSSYYPKSIKLSLEEVWTELDLNFKHITLGTYDWTDETSNYINTANQYPSMEASGFYTLPGALDTTPHYPKTKFLGDCGRDFIRLIYNVFSCFEASNTNYFRDLHETVKDSLLGYLTFNYDCFLEHSLAEESFKYIPDNLDTSSLEDLIEGGTPIIKLHGSLSWLHRCGCQRIEFKAPPFNTNVQVEPIYKNNLEWSEPAIIPPTFYKQQINDDSRRGIPLTETILQQWRAALSILKNVEKIIFVGYSFPASDFHSKRLFQLSKMHSNKPIKILDCIGPYDDENEKRSFLMRIFGPGADIQFVRLFDRLINSDKLKRFLAA